MMPTVIFWQRILCWPCSRSMNPVIDLHSELPDGAGAFDKRQSLH